MVNYFAYGSNMDPLWLRKRGVFIYGMRPAILWGWRLAFNKQAVDNPSEGFANIIPDELSRVEGIMYEVEEDDLRKLDVFEGYPVHYQKRFLTVNLYGGWTAEAVVYIANGNQVKDGLKPGKEYLKHLLAAGRYLTKGYYEQLKKAWK